MCSALLLVAPNASAQFFKKLGKAIQEVDKALGERKQKRENRTQIRISLSKLHKLMQKK